MSGGSRQPGLFGPDRTDETPEDDLEPSVDDRETTPDDPPDAALGLARERSASAEEVPPPADAVRRTRRAPGWYSRRPRRIRMLLWLLLVVWVAGGMAILFFDLVPVGIGPRPGGGPGPVDTETTVLVVRAGADAPEAIALLHRTDREGEVVLLPAATVVEVPGVGPRSLGVALRQQGRAAFAASLANVLGIRVPPVVETDADGMTALARAVGTVAVDVPETIEVEQDGVLRTLFGQGVSEMDAEAFSRFLLMQVPGQRELERVARQSAAWRGLLDALARADVAVLGDGVDSWTGDLGPDEIAARLAAHARRDDGAFLTLPVRRVGVTGEDLYEVDRDQLGPVHDALEATRTVGATEGRRVRLLVGAEGALGPAVTARLLEAGFVVVLTGRASEPYDVTRVVIAENAPALRKTGRELLDVMGMGRLGVFRRPQTVFDATLVVGGDWAEANGFPQPPPSTAPRR